MNVDDIVVWSRKFDSAQRVLISIGDLAGVGLWFPVDDLVYLRVDMAQYTWIRGELE